MAPLLLDRHSLIKSVLSLCLLLTIVFFGGYYSGYTKGYGHAESRLRQVTLPPVALVLPEPAHANTAIFEPQPPAVIEPGADIDVDRPDALSAQDDAREPAGNQQTASREDFHADSSSPPVQLASLDVTPAIVADVTAKARSLEQKSGDVSALASNASVTEARYSIQVGMYGGIGNAEQLFESLNASRLDAYIDEFSNASGEPRFNVRFGFYRDRASAKAALQAYQSQLDGEGYVVRVSD